MESTGQKFSSYRQKRLNLPSIGSVQMGEQFCMMAEKQSKAWKQALEGASHG
jgi:hypothetical protein